MWKILRANMSTLSVKEEPYPDEYMGLGGRSLIARIMTDEVDPACGPLGPGNKLLLSTGAFAGSGLSCANRLSVGCKSPLTGGIKEANAGGTIGTYMAGHGVRLIIIEGRPRQEGLWLLHVDAAGKAALVEAGAYREMDNYPLVEALMARYGNDIAVASIGRAGERLYRNSTVQVTDYGSNYPCRAAARGGVGAVMGSKKVKAVIFEKPAVRCSPAFADRERFFALRKDLNKILADGAAGSPLRRVGTADGVVHKQEVGCLPVRNYSGKKLEGIEKIASARFMEIINSRGRNGRACQPGCVVRCSNLIQDENGSHLTGGLEYETVALCGANCEITDYNVIMRMDRFCDDLGLDTIETGATIALCMEAGKIPWGDGEAALALLREMAEGTEFGRIMGNGAEATGNYLGVKRIPACKHQAMSGYDPRGAVVTGVAYATSAMGADHTVAPFEGTCAEMPPEEICSVSKKVQSMFAMTDSLFCGFAWIFWNKHLEKLAELYAALYGGEALPDRLTALGELTLKLEREFNKAAGWKDTDDVLPSFFYTERSEITGITFHVPPENLARTFKNGS